MDDLYSKIVKNIQEFLLITISDIPNFIVTPQSARISQAAVLCIAVDASAKMFYPKYYTNFFRFLSAFRKSLVDTAVKFGADINQITLNGNGITAFFTKDGISNNIWSALITAAYARDFIVDIFIDTIPSFRLLEIKITSAITVETFFETTFGYIGNTALSTCIANLYDNAGKICLCEDAYDRLNISNFIDTTKIKAEEALKKIFHKHGSTVTANGVKKLLYSFDKSAFETIISL